MTDWELDDVEAAARAHPNSFFIPSEAERHSQGVGDLVQLHFVLPQPGPGQPRAERMWVEISKVEPGGGVYEGLLTNRPQAIAGLKIGDPIRFETRHIAQTIIKKDDPRWLDCSEQAALVSRLVFEGDRTVRFAYREKPDNERDSGWRLMSGAETDEYNDDPRNIRICNIGWLVDYDPSLHALFKHGVDSVFERRDKQQPWQRVTDWRPRED